MKEETKEGSKRKVEWIWRSTGRLSRAIAVRRDDSYSLPIFVAQMACLDFDILAIEAPILRETCKIEI